DAELDHLVVVGDGRDCLDDGAPGRDEGRHLCGAEQPVHQLDAELRIGLGVEDDHFELLAVDAAGLVDFRHRPFGRLYLVLPVERLRARQRHGEAEAKDVLRRGRRHRTECQDQTGSRELHSSTTIKSTHQTLPWCCCSHAAARSTDFSAASASSVLITSAYFSDMSNRLTACDTWLRS